MLSSHKAAVSRDMYGSPTRAVIPWTSRTGHRSRTFPTYHPSKHRYFSWGAKHKWSSSRAGKVCKGFSTHDPASKVVSRKGLYRGTYWDHDHVLRRYLPRYLPVQEWRSASCWKNPGGRWARLDEANTKNKTEESAADDWFSKWEKQSDQKVKEHEDWYTRWESRKMKQYDDFMKKVEEDPFKVVFGKSWLNWGDDAGHTTTAQTPGRTAKEKSSASKTENPPTEDVWARTRKKNGEMQSSQKGFGGKEPSHETTVQSQDREYDIDPITMRKVPKKAPSPILESKSPAQGVQQSFDIPVKRFCASTTGIPMSHGMDKVPTIPISSIDAFAFEKPRGAQSWLTQEGFVYEQEHPKIARSTEKNGDVRPRAAPKIETALNRHLQGKSSTTTGPSRQSLQYEPQENKAEDVDLLRSSDVRASAGLRGKIAKESDAEKQARQQKLEEEYESRTLDREDQLAREIAAKPILHEGKDDFVERKAPRKAVFVDPKKTLNDIENEEIPGPFSASISNEVADWESDMPIVDRGVESMKAEPDKPQKLMATKDAFEAQALISDKANKIKAQIVPLKAKIDAMRADYDALRQRWLEENHRQKVAKKVSAAHEEEVQVQKAAMEAIEGSVKNVSNRNLAPTQDVKPAHRQLHGTLPGEGDMASNVHEFAGRDRWYKQKAPHAMGELDLKLQKVAKDKALVREVRGIYEEAYGTIDTHHRQPSQPGDEPTPLVTSEVQAPSVAIATASLKFSGSAEPSDSSTQDLSKPQTSPHPQILDEPQSSDALAIIQKLFNELREAQSIIQDHRSQLNQTTNTNDSTIMLRASKAYEQSVKKISQAAWKLAKTSQGLSTDSMAPGFVNTGTSVNSMQPTILRSMSTSGDTSSPSVPSIYRILAYDSSTQKVTSAKTTSLAPISKERTLLPDEALMSLTNPGRFLPHVVSLHNKGYEIVSGANNVLVFKKVRDTDAADEDAPAKTEDAMRYPNHIDGTTAQTGNFASPTGFVNHDPLTLPDDMVNQQSTSPPPSNNSSSGKVRRKEDVFSGSSRGGWQDGHGKRLKGERKKSAKRKKTFRRMLMVGAYTAACCYAVGIGVEMMR